MALKAFYDSSEEIPKDQAGFYAERDGKFWLDVEGTQSVGLVDHGALKNALTTERSARRELEKRLETFADLDPEAAREALAKLAEMADRDPKAEADEKYRSQLEQLRKKHESELRSAQEESGKYKEQLKRELINVKLTQAILEQKGSPDLLLRNLLSEVDMRETETGEYEGVVVDPRGNPRITMEPGSSGNMTFAELVKEAKTNPKYERAFEFEGRSGGGGRGTETVTQKPGEPMRIHFTDRASISANREKIKTGEAVVVEEL